MYLLARRLALLLLVIAGCSSQSSTSSKSVPLTIYAAASTRLPVEKLAKQFGQEHSATVEVVPGPSSGLSKQIEKEGRADLFLSADLASVDYLADKGLVAERRNLLTNRLVVIVPGDSKLDVTKVEDLAKPEFKRIAVAEPKVPAGEYARDALRKTDILEKIQDRFVGGIDVTATLQFVARGEADAGFVYLTDTIGNSKVRVALEVDPKLHKPIVYPLALLKVSAGKQEAKAFFEFLGSAKAAEVFRAAKFNLAED
jgi:molybdate transport system substrate-binding protein